MSGAALVTVAIPAYKNEATIAATLESVFAQSYRPIEVVVVDDGSPDRTGEVLAGFGDRIRVIAQANQGVAAARNAGMSAARGDFIALLDGDDLCEPDRIAAQVAAFARFPEAVACSTDFSAFDEDGVVAESFGRTYYSAIDEIPGGLDALYPREARIDVGGRTVKVACGDVYPALAFGNFVHPPTTTFRKSALHKSGMQQLDLRYTSDWEWTVRLARVGPFIHVFEPLLRYRLSRTQISRTGANMALDIVRTYGKIVDGDPELVRQHRTRVRRNLAAFHLDAAYGLSAERKREAALQLSRALANGGWGLEAARIAARIAVPRRMLEAIAARRSGV